MWCCDAALLRCCFAAVAAVSASPCGRVFAVSLMDTLLRRLKRMADLIPRCKHAARRSTMRRTTDGVRQSVLFSTRKRDRRSGWGWWWGWWWGGLLERETGRGNNFLVLWNGSVIATTTLTSQPPPPTRAGVGTQMPRTENFAMTACSGGPQTESAMMYYVKLIIFYGPPRCSAVKSALIIGSCCVFFIPQCDWGRGGN